MFMFMFMTDSTPFKLQNQENSTISQQVREYLESSITPLIILEGKYTDKLKIIQSHRLLFLNNDLECYI